jgi:hypothetical protein
MPTKKFGFALAVVALSAVVSGCSESGPATHPVTGKITVGGAVPQGVTLTFHPVGTQQSASAVIDAQGNYTLYTGNKGKPGAEAGKYKIVLGQGAGQNAAGQAYQSSGQQTGTSSAPPVPQLSFPADWTDPEKSPKEVEVTAGDNKIDIEVPAAE